MGDSPRQIEWARNSTGSPAMTDDQFVAVHRSLGLVPTSIAQSAQSANRPAQEGKHDGH